MIRAGDLGEDAEGAGLGGAGAGVPVLGVLDQPLLAGVAVRGRVVELRVGVHDVLPWGAAPGTDTAVSARLHTAPRSGHEGTGDFSQHLRAASALRCRGAAAEAQLNTDAVF